MARLLKKLTWCRVDRAKQVKGFRSLPTVVPNGSRASWWVGTFALGRYAYAAPWTGASTVPIMSLLTSILCYRIVYVVSTRPEPSLERHVQSCRQWTIDEEVETQIESIRELGDFELPGPEPVASLRRGQCSILQSTRMS